MNTTKSKKDNPNFPKEVNKVGGMQVVVTSTVGRNMWAIMKQFNKLPNDPLIQSLTYSQREFIIASMIQDAQEEKARMNGEELTEQAIDTSEDYDDVFNGRGKYAHSLIDDDVDPDAIYEQVVANTKDKEYDKNLEIRIQNAILNKEEKDRMASVKQSVSLENMSDELKEALSYQPKMNIDKD